MPKLKFQIKSKVRNPNRFLAFGALTLFGIWILAFGFLTHDTYAAEYTLIQPLPDLKTVSSFPQYVSRVIPILLGFAAVLATVMIVIWGIAYALSEAVDSKARAKEGIWSAILGLLLALTAWLILFTINPDLVVLQLNIPNVRAPAAQQTQQQAPITNPTGQTPRPGGTVQCTTCFGNGTQAGSFTVGDDSWTMDQKFARCQQLCVTNPAAGITKAQCSGPGQTFSCSASNQTTQQTQLTQPTTQKCCISTPSRGETCGPPIPKNTCALHCKAPQDNTAQCK